MNRIATLSLLLLASCTATDTGNPVEVQVGLQGYDASAPGALTLGEGWAVEEAWVVLSSLRLRESDGDCATPGPAGPEVGPLAAELVSGRVLPERPALSGTTSQYCRIDLKFHKLRPADIDVVPAELEGLAVRVVGVAPDARPFVLEGEFTDPWHLVAPGDGFDLSSSSGVVLGFAMDEWLDGEDLSAAEGSDSIRISRTENRSLHDAFREAVKRSGRLLSDDGDGVLSSSESSSDPLAAGETE